MRLKNTDPCLQTFYNVSKYKITTKFVKKVPVKELNTENNRKCLFLMCSKTNTVSAIRLIVK